MSPSSSASLRDDEHLGVAELLSRASAAGARHLAPGVRRHAVEHERDRRPAVAGGVQQVPRHGVGVAGGGRDEEPAVGGGEQLVGECAVLREDGVDVG